MGQARQIQVGDDTFEVSEPKEKVIYLLTCTDADGKEVERLVEAAKPTDAMRMAVGVQRAKPEDVARVMQAGGKVEKAE